MGEAKRKRAAALSGEKWPGSDQRCPRCLSEKVGTTAFPETNFYAKRIAVCGNCKAAWEPIDTSLIWDRSEERSCFSEPCDNCAFRPQSPEQADTEKWKQTIASLRDGGTFYCHKGVPISPESTNGFDYPAQRHKLRICKGYINALRVWWKDRKGSDHLGDSSP